jgi:hypothetical protein
MKFKELHKIMTRFIQLEGIEKTKIFQIWDEMEKIGVACKPREPYHHKIQEYNDLNYGKSRWINIRQDPHLA